MILGLFLLGGVPALGFAVWASMLAWRGNWQAAALTLGAPLLLAALIAALAMSGPLDAGHSEDWGPLMAMLFAAALAVYSLVASAIAGIVGFVGHRRRAASTDNVF